MIKRRSQGGAAELRVNRSLPGSRQSCCATEQRVSQAQYLPPPRLFYKWPGRGCRCMFKAADCDPHTASLFCSRGCDRRRKITLCRNLPVFSQNKAGGGEAHLLAWSTRTVCEYIYICSFFSVAVWRHNWRFQTTIFYFR